MENRLIKGQEMCDKLKKMRSVWQFANAGKWSARFLTVVCFSSISDPAFLVTARVFVSCTLLVLLSTKAVVTRQIKLLLKHCRNTKHR